jgi:hypothetical protein
MLTSLPNNLDSKSAFWQYLSQNQQDLIKEGYYLSNQIVKNDVYHFKDYSFIVFPFAKAYEGFLKKLFLDVDFISRLDYISDHLRLGKLLSPNLMARLGDESLYRRIKHRTSEELADLIWQTWKLGRNEIFHYYPHNYKLISFEEAEAITDHLIKTMQRAYEEIHG